MLNPPGCQVEAQWAPLASNWNTCAIMCGIRCKLHVWIPLESNLNPTWNKLESNGNATGRFTCIQMENHQNPTRILLEPYWRPIGDPLAIRFGAPLYSKLKPNWNPNGIHLESHGDPLESNWNRMLIPFGIHFESDWKPHGIPLASNLNTIGSNLNKIENPVDSHWTPIGIHWKPMWGPTWIPPWNPINMHLKP